MSEDTDKPRIYLGMPGYGRLTAAAARGLWYATQDDRRVITNYQCGSLLAANFNILWASALNVQRAGIPVAYFAMLHDDIGPEDWWLDTLIEELEARDLDILGVVSPIKDMNGLTSIALDREDHDTWRVKCRLTMDEIYRLPETFTSEDVGHDLLLNTGCWVCRFDPRWNDKVYFTINDRIVWDEIKQKYAVEVESEDWFFSRLCHEQNLKLGATRKVRLSHRGDIDFLNDHAWGQHKFDQSFVTESLIPVVEPAAEPALALTE